MRTIQAAVSPQEEAKVVDQIGLLGEEELHAVENDVLLAIADVAHDVQELLIDVGLVAEARLPKTK